MSLIHTCELCGANPFDYLTELQKHAEGLAKNPGSVDAVELRRDAGPVQHRGGFWVADPFLKYNAFLWPKTID